jgi:tetratricopeptide (TPR) repeat protein
MRSFFNRLFGRNSAPSEGNAAKAPIGNKTEGESSENIRVYNQYGQELWITKQQWRDNVLFGNLDGARDDPDRLYSFLVGALEDGFGADIVPYAEHLAKTDSIPTRGPTILAIVYMECGRLDDAEHVLTECIARNGEEGIMLCNLAKIHSRRGDSALAERTLWHALELDPNQDNGLGWYAALNRERGGEGAELQAYGRVAALPKSWRARLYLARDALQRGRTSEASILYDEASRNAGSPPPEDLLFQMSGDLGKAGRLEELVERIASLFDPALHGLGVGNNLIKAYVDLQRPVEAKRVLERLHALQRPDWKETLNFWETTIAKLQLPTAPLDFSSNEVPNVTVIVIEGPLWMRDGSPFGELAVSKAKEAPRIAFFGSTVLVDNRTTAGPRVQLADNPGRLSRALPLVLAESVHLATNVIGKTIVPWFEFGGFAVFSTALDDKGICRVAGESADFVAGIGLDVTDEPSTASLRLVRVSDGVCVGSLSEKMSMENPGPGAERLVRSVLHLVQGLKGAKPSVPPEWYCRPDDREGSDYLLRLEQQLAVATTIFQKGSISGEREILDGSLQLCVRNSTNATVRMLYAQTLRQMRKIRPDIVPEYRTRNELLAREHPIGGEIDILLERAFVEAFEPAKYA